MYLTAAKILLSLPVAYGLAYPLFNPQGGTGILDEISVLGPLGTFATTAAFLLLVLLYCLDLRKVLSLIDPKYRAAAPNSVWLMFLIPYNFIEDFFIIYNVSASIKNISFANSNIKSMNSTGIFAGIGWCFAQIVSLLPNSIGTIAGLIAIPLWIMHWRFTRSVIKTLRR